MGVFDAIGNLAGAVIGGGQAEHQNAQMREFNAAESATARQFAAREAQKADIRARTNYGERYQMQVNDLKAAGLNPMLAVSQGAGSGPGSGAQASATSASVGPGHSKGQLTQKAMHDTVASAIDLFRKSAENKLSKKLGEKAGQDLKTGQADEIKKRMEALESMQRQKGLTYQNQIIESQVSSAKAKQKYEHDLYDLKTKMLLYDYFKKDAKDIISGGLGALGIWKGASALKNLKNLKPHGSLKGLGLGPRR